MNTCEDRHSDEQAPHAIQVSSFDVWLDLREMLADLGPVKTGSGPKRLHEPEAACSKLATDGLDRF